MISYIQNNQYINNSFIIGENYSDNRSNKMD